MSNTNQHFFMEHQFYELSGHPDGFDINTQTLPSYHDAYGRLATGSAVDDPSFTLGELNYPFLPCDSGPSSSGLSLSLTSEVDTPSADCDDSVFQIINQIDHILMEEDLDEMPCMFHDSLALQAAEKSFYDVLCDKNSSNHSHLHADSADDNISWVSSCSAGNSSCTATSRCSSVEFPESRLPSILQSPVPENIIFQASIGSSAQSKQSQRNHATEGNRSVKSPLNELLGPNFFTDSMSMVFFQKGIEEASKFIPKGNQLMIDLDKCLYQKGVKEGSKFIPKVVDLTGDPQRKIFHPSSKGMTSSGGSRSDKTGCQNSRPNELKLKKKHEREDVNLEDARTNKQMAVAVEEGELTEMFDKVLLCAKNAFQDRVIQTLPQPSVPSSDSSMEKLALQKPGAKREVVDLRSLLISCAQAASIDDDRQKAAEYLRQIRQHSSPFGDGIQRLAHLFSNALEARISGTGTQIYTDLDAKRTSASDMLKAYQVYLSVFPFQRFAIIFSNHMILGCAERATKLHIIDFGILYGFQWPPLIHCLARRSGGPPKLRITGIELPQRGFRPDERVRATGSRLAKYCERFGVPFEYQSIAQKWDTIRVEDLKLRKDEVVAVNCLFRFKNLLDETVVHTSPRDHVLSLIRKLRPSIFVHSIVNASYNASFFVSRFREAIFHFSPLFDAFDMKVPRENHMRLMFEKEFFGREAMNVIACEGTERVERPETYKQWQIRNTRAGMRAVPLDPKITKKLKSKLKEGYLEHFVIDEDGQWMLQGWKGRILYASSCWVPSS